MKNLVVLSLITLLVGFTTSAIANDGQNHAPAQEEMIGSVEGENPSGQWPSEEDMGFIPTDEENPSSPHFTNEEENIAPMISEDGEESGPFFPEEDSSGPIFTGDDEIFPLESEEAIAKELDSINSNN